MDGEVQEWARQVVEAQIAMNTARNYWQRVWLGFDVPASTTARAWATKVAAEAQYNTAYEALCRATGWHRDTVVGALDAARAAYRAEAQASLDDDAPLGYYEHKFEQSRGK